MTKNDALAQARQEHARLGEEIAAHDRAYYQNDAPKITDAEYDDLRRRYVALEAEFPELADDELLSRKVGAARRKNSPRSPMPFPCCRSAIFSPTTNWSNLSRA